MRAGEITAEEAARHPQRNILTRALGIEADPLNDSWDLVPVHGDRYLLCSDGLFNELDDERLAEVLSKGSVQEVADRLVDEAVDNGGHDNVTVLVAEVVAGPEPRGTNRPAIPMARSEQALRSSPVPETGPGVVRASLASASCILAAAVLVLGMYAHQGWLLDRTTATWRCFGGARRAFCGSSRRWWRVGTCGSPLWTSRRVSLSTRRSWLDPWTRPDV